eukprot:TRINITY_DN1110_c1_g2_i1.p1 TRINITY_DN1110_c1_g2~~TRINITY_DN1110_c1_g2_i1.p1  ORF type:complete len:650 (-),score=134.41 TRINITY_DN1110_c1_g2_i1:24-1715(-)
MTQTLDGALDSPFLAPSSAAGSPVVPGVVLQLGDSQSQASPVIARAQAPPAPAGLEISVSRAAGPSAPGSIANFFKPRTAAPVDPIAPSTQTAGNLGPDRPPVSESAPMTEELHKYRRKRAREIGEEGEEEEQEEEGGPQRRTKLRRTATVVLDAEEEQAWREQEQQLATLLALKQQAVETRARAAELAARGYVDSIAPPTGLGGAESTQQPISALPRTADIDAAALAAAPVWTGEEEEPEARRRTEVDDDDADPGDDVEALEAQDLEDLRRGQLEDSGKVVPGLIAEQEVVLDPRAEREARKLHQVFEEDRDEEDLRRVRDALASVRARRAEEEEENDPLMRRSRRPQLTFNTGEQIFDDTDSSASGTDSEKEDFQARCTMRAAIECARLESLHGANSNSRAPDTVSPILASSNSQSRLLVDEGSQHILSMIRKTNVAGVGEKPSPEGVRTKPRTPVRTQALKRQGSFLQRSPQSLGKLARSTNLFSAAAAGPGRAFVFRDDSNNAPQASPEVAIQTSSQPLQSVARQHPAALRRVASVPTSVPAPASAGSFFDLLKQAVPR